MVCPERDIAWIGDSVPDVLLRGFETGGASVRARHAGDLPTLLEFTDHRRKPDSSQH